MVLASNHRHTTFSEHDMIQENDCICIDTNFSEHDTVHTVMWSQRLNVFEHDTVQTWGHRDLNRCEYDTLHTCGRRD